MGIWDSIKAKTFLEVIEWTDSTNNTIVYRFPTHQKAITDGSKLVVREGQAAVFINEGQLSDVFGPGSWDLDTRNTRILSFFKTIGYGFDDPYKGEIYFLNTKQFTDQKWGTSNPFMMRDPDFGVVRVRAFGSYCFRVTDPAQFLRQVVGTDHLFKTGEITGQLKRKLISSFTDAVVETRMGVLDLGAQFTELGDDMCKQMTPWFTNHYGITLTDFAIVNLSLPPNVEKALDERTSMGIVGDMGAYTQFQTAKAIRESASAPGGGNPMMQAGMGFAVGNQMANQMAQSQGGQFNPQHGLSQGHHAPPPPPPPQQAASFHYSGPGGQKQGLSAAQIAAEVSANRSGAHNIWAPGWPGWKPWDQVAEIASLVAPAQASFHYSGPSGQQQGLSAQAVADKVKAAPSANHNVWAQGWPGWKPARDVPEIAVLLGGGPPPPPPM